MMTAAGTPYPRVSAHNRCQSTSSSWSYATIGALHGIPEPRRRALSQGRVVGPRVATWLRHPAELGTPEHPDLRAREHALFEHGSGFLPPGNVHGVPALHLEGGEFRQLVDLLVDASFIQVVVAGQDVQ